MLRPPLPLVAGLLALVSACSPSDRDATSRPAPAETPPTAPAPSAVSTSTSTVAAPPTPVSTSAPSRPPSSPGIAILRSAAAVEPAARLPLTPGVEAVVHPAATFEVELSARSSDARLVLVDARDDLVPASSTREVSAATRLTLAPSAPLTPGSRYVLRLDGVAHRDLHDDAGRAFSAVSLPLLVAGSPPPAEQKKPARRKRRP